MSRVFRLLIVMMVVLAACGGGDDEPAASTTVAASGDGSTTTTEPTTVAPTTAPAPVANPSDDFCGFAIEYAESVDFSPLSMNPGELESILRATNDAIDQAAQTAPSEIRADVQMYADAYGGFIEILDELDFNFLAFNDDMLDDPRLLALEDPALEEAGERISAYCGIDDFLVAGPGAVGGTGGPDDELPEVDLPDDFPTELVPPGGKAVVSLDISGSKSVTFDVESSADDVIAYYSGVIGEPTVEMNDPDGALWSTQYGGSTVNVVVSESTPGMAQVNIIIE